MKLNIHQHLLPYVNRLQARSVDDINLVVIHCTELPDLAMARVFGQKERYRETGTGNCGHFYIDRDGSTEQWVPFDRIAHHVKGFNPQSIGIELVNNGRYPDWFHTQHQEMSEPYPEQQIEALTALLHHLQLLLPGLEKVAGHEDLDTGMIASEDRPELMIRRKLDPGILFPWSVLMDEVSLQRVMDNKL